MSWDAFAPSFDDQPDHGLRDPVVRAAWRAHLLSWLPPAPSRILEVGCGTGSLMLLLDECGHSVVGLDRSSAMLSLARLKSPRSPLIQADASDPPFADGSFDVVLARHVVWALPDPSSALRRWLRLADRLVLIEGRWDTGAGLTADELTSLLSPLDVRVRRLADPALWGHPIEDERYAVLVSGVQSGR